MDIIGTITSIASPVISFAMSNELILISLLAIFIVIAMKLFFLLKEAVFVAIISALFPIVLVKLFNLPFDLTTNLVLVFALAGVVLLLVYRIFETVWVGTSILSIPLKLLFRVLTNQYIIIILLLALLAGFLYFNGSGISIPSLNLSAGIGLNTSCITAEDCAFVNTECCWRTGIGTAVNAIFAEKIVDYNNKHCDRSNCSALENVNAMEKSNGIITSASPYPKAVCNLGKCELDMEIMSCTIFCQSFSDSSQSEALNFTAYYLGMDLETLKQKCNC